MTDYGLVIYGERKDRARFKEWIENLRLRELKEKGVTKWADSPSFAKWEWENLRVNPKDEKLMDKALAEFIDEENHLKSQLPMWHWLKRSFLFLLPKRWKKPVSSRSLRKKRKSETPFGCSERVFKAGLKDVGVFVVAKKQDVYEWGKGL